MLHGAENFYLRNGSLLTQIGLLLIALSPIAYIPDIYYNGEFAKHTVFLTGMVLFALGFALRRTPGFSRPATRYDSFGIFFLIFLIAGLLGNLWRRNIDRTYFMILFYSSQLMIYMTFVNIGPVKNIRRFLLTVFLAASLNAVIGILQTYDINPLDFVQLAKPAGTFMNRNFLAHFLDLVWPVIFLVPTTKNRLLQILRYLGIFAIAYCIIALGSRGLWLAILMSISGLVILLTATGRISKLGLRRFRVPILICCLAAACFFITSKFGGPTETTLNIETKFQSMANPISGSAQVRLTLWRNSFTLIKDNYFLPLGHGEMPFSMQAYADYPESMGYGPHRAYYQHVHNEYLRVAAEAGPVGLLFYLAAFATILLRFVRYLKATTVPSTNVLVLFMGFSALCVHSFFEFPQYSVASGCLFPVFLGLLSVRLGNLHSLQNLNSRLIWLATSSFFVIMLSLSALNIIGGYKYTQMIEADVTPSVCRKSSHMYAAALKYLQYEPGLTLSYPIFFAYCFSREPTAISVLELYYRDYPEYPRLWHQLAALYFEKGEHDKALIFIKKIRERQPSEPLGKILYGFHLLIKGEKRLGAALINEGLAVDSSYEHLVSNLMAGLNRAH